MEQSQANQLIMMYSSKLSPEYIPTIRERIMGMEYATAMAAFSDIKDPTISIILSILLGELGASSERRSVAKKPEAPEIKIGTDDKCIWADIMFKRERGGNAGAPKYECLSGRYGPEIADGVGPEEFFDPFELDKRLKSLGGETERAFVEEEGAWTYERRRYVKIFVAPGKWDKCKEVLKPIMDKWYTFPIEVREVDFAKRK